MVQESSLKKIVIIAGPTASGKTSLSLKCAKAFNGAIVGCESMQIYQGLDIGTGKLPPSEREQIPHFMIDIIPPNSDFSVNEYIKLADSVIENITADKKAPFLVGGTGFYMSGLLYGLDFAGAGKSDKIREKYKEILKKRGKEYLYEILKKIDPASCEKININDTKRVIRAIEIFESTGKSKSQSSTNNRIAKYNYKMIVLSPPRQKLYADINARVNKMIESGLVEEVASLYQYKDCQSMTAIGYKEIIDYLDGVISLNSAVEQIKINTRHYAKRQLTYFKNSKMNSEFYDNYDENCDKQILSDIENYLKG